MLHGLGDCSPELHCGCLDQNTEGVIDDDPEYSKKMSYLKDALYRTRARNKLGNTCRETIWRRGVKEDCGKEAVCLRDDAFNDVYYPVCVRHTRGFCIPIVEPDDAQIIVEYIEKNIK